MTIDEIKLKTDEMIKKLVDCLELDGDYYVSINKCPIVYASTSGVSEFLTARSSNLKKFLDRVNLDNKQKEYIFNEGLIVVNKNIKNIRDDFDKTDLFITVIHEKLHANRMLLINSQKRESRAVNGVLYDNGHFVRNYDNTPYYADSSQEILKASIDDSQDTYEKYSKMSFDEKEDLTENNDEYDNKMYQQFKIDEALVETMAIVANRLCEEKTNDIMAIIRKINERYSGDIKAITSIILRHNDLELFKWMIDPISYEIGVANYDFFSHYITPDDIGDLNSLIKSDDTMFDDDEHDDAIRSSRAK